MSSRFVRGWKVSTQMLQEIVGVSRVTPSDVLRARVNKRILRDVFMTLGEGEEQEEIAEGRAVATKALVEVLEGKPKAQMAYSYARVLELILNHVAKPMAVTEAQEIVLALTYHVPNEDFGRWNPILKACGLPRLAKLWALDNFPFPWRTGRARVDWPVWTVMDPRAVAGVSAELLRLRREDLTRVADEDWSDQVDEAEEARKEMWQGLRKLQRWVHAVTVVEEQPPMCCAATGNSLVLSMDGDQ